jgi:hypothetical protein
MSIRPFLSGQPFDPETIDKMSVALQSVCDTLSLKMVDDAATRLVARKIIELTQRGVRDAAALRAMTLKDLSTNSGAASRLRAERHAYRLQRPC